MAELKNCDKSVTVIRPQSGLFPALRLSGYFIEMFFRHHSPSPDCGYYHKVLQRFCKQKRPFVTA
ncbi:MAG: hypothetical protein IJ479_01490 [Alphaproteobacteria bacterium]|nr:hypothetical protein [Alphaproteobacteria bacterium]